MSVSRIFLDAGMKSLKHCRAGGLKENHKIMRLTFAEKFSAKEPQFWDELFSTDEKMWEMHAKSVNRQNKRVRASSSSDVQPLFLTQFPAKLHVWGGMSARGVSRLHVIEGSLNGEGYAQLLEEEITEIRARTAVNGPATTVKLFPEGAA